MIDYFKTLFSGESPTALVAQIIGFVAMGLIFASYQQKKVKSIILLQLFSAILWSAHMLMLGALAGTLLNFIEALRAVVFACREKHAWARKRIWFVVFIAAFGIAALVSAFQGDGWIALLPFVAMVASTFALSASKSSSVRLLSLLSSPCWLCYDLISASIAGTISEIFNLVSIFSGMLRIDLPAYLKKRREQTSKK